MTGWLERYRRGDRVQVWTEMAGPGAALRETEHWPEAVEVARETMRRARANVERLAEALPSIGYEFARPEGVLTPPEPDVSARLDDIEGLVGALPLALRCWYEEVGQVDLTGTHPDWGFAYTDPLVVEAPLDYVRSQYAEWEADRGTEWDQGDFVVDLAPDYLHKADVSGGPAYAMAVPDGGADGLFRYERHNTTFVNYLRICFHWAGLPGWDSGARDDWARPAMPCPTALTELARTLLLL